MDYFYGMRIKRYLLICAVSMFTASCSSTKKVARPAGNNVDHITSKPATGKAKTFIAPLKTDRRAFVAYAKTLLGTPYKYASAIPANGLDCSGFIYYVFNHFGVKSPRSSVDFTNEGITIDPEQAKPGDLILFTGSDNSSGVVGHMGIVTSNDGTLSFIHASSGRSVGVIISTLSGYYRTHFVKVIRVLE